jgi:hypothetical protein
MNSQPPALKPRPVHPSSRPQPVKPRPLDRPKAQIAMITTEYAHRLLALFVLLFVISLGSCTIAPILGALEGARIHAPAKTAMVA